MISEADLIRKGFRILSDGIYQKEVNGRYIKCYKNPGGAGYWVCEIDPIGASAANDRIATIEQIDDFIETTCQSGVTTARVHIRE